MNSWHARTNPDVSDRRRYRRWQVNLPVRELKPERHLMRATTVSAGGVFCPDAMPRPPGSRLLLEIDPLGVGQAFVVVAEVVHAGHGDSGFGLGLAFAEPQRELADRIREMLTEQG